MAQYIVCDYCGAKIPFGTTAYHKDYCGVFCSTECYFDSHGAVSTVDEEFANYCDHIIYDDDLRKIEIKKEIEKHNNAIERLKQELETL